MKIVLGLYTQVTQNSPSSAYKRALSCILKPVLTYLHNNQDYALSLSMSSAMIRYLSQHVPEMNLLINSLARKNRLELFTSALNQTILPLVPQKDRASVIDKCTTLIRKTYGVRSTTLWCYGQIWSSSMMMSMKLIGLDRVVISSWDAIARKNIPEEPFRMYELGRRVDVIPATDSASRLVSSYAQNEITIDELNTRMRNLIASSSRDELVLMINIDQLCQGASYHREDDEKLSLIFSSIFEAGAERGATFALPQEIEPRGLGYLTGSWYGRDASTQCVSSFNELFVRNGSYRYYLGRVLALTELASECKKDRTVRRLVLDLLSSIPSGPMFLCDTHASALRLSEHRHYYRTLLEAEKRLQECGLLLTSADLDNDLLEEEFCYGKVNSAVFSRRGGSVLEYNARELGLNIFDTVSPWVREQGNISRLTSFTETVSFNGVTDDLCDEVFELESVSRSRTDFNFTYDHPKRSYEILKHYRLSNQNLYLSVTFINQGDTLIDGEYTSQIYFTLPDSSAFAYDSKRELLVGNALSGIRSVRFSDANNQLGLFFTSTDFFTATEENRYQSEVTAIGSEQFYLYTKLSLAFKLSVAPRSAATFNIVTRINSTKEKE